MPPNKLPSVRETNDDVGNLEATNFPERTQARNEICWFRWLFLYVTLYFLFFLIHFLSHSLRTLVTFTYYCLFKLVCDFLVRDGSKFVALFLYIMMKRYLCILIAGIIEEVIRRSSL